VQKRSQEVQVESSGGTINGGRLGYWPIKNVKKIPYKKGAKKGGPYLIHGGAKF